MLNDREKYNLLHSVALCLLLQLFIYVLEYGLFFNLLPGVQVFFSLKKHVKFGNFFKVSTIVCCTFSPCFGQFVNTTSLLLWTIHQATFSHLRMNLSIAQQVRDPSMQTNDNRKETSLVSKPHEVELPSWVLPTYRAPVSILSYMMENCNEETWLYVVSFGLVSFWPFFKQGTIQIGQMLLVTFSIKHFLRL